MQRSFAEYAKVTLKGMAMGAADVVPGVSGGTIAFISGIYEELIGTIDKIDFQFFKAAKQEGFLTAWKSYNLSFLLALALGIGISIITFAKIISYLLDNEPILLWSFFFGLVIASIVYVIGQMDKWRLMTFVCLLIGIAVSYYVTVAEPVSSPESSWFLFFSGFVAIIAMILPGVSGAFILLLLGSYHAVIAVINELSTAIFDLKWEIAANALSKLLIFALGALLGIKIFSKLLSWMFRNHKNLTLALLTGFMIGSLNKIWPWKEVVTSYTNSHGKVVPILEENVWPHNFSEDPQILLAIASAVVGFLTIFLLEKYAVKKKNQL